LPYFGKTKPFQSKPVGTVLPPGFFILCLFNFIFLTFVSCGYLNSKMDFENLAYPFLKADPNLLYAYYLS